MLAGCTAALESSSHEKAVGAVAVDDDPTRQTLESARSELVTRLHEAEILFSVGRHDGDWATIGVLVPEDRLDDALPIVHDVVDAHDIPRAAVVVEGTDGPPVTIERHSSRPIGGFVGSHP